MIRSRALCFSAVALLVACSDTSFTPLGESGCALDDLATGVVMRYRTGGGIAGRSTTVEAYADGRVEVTTDGSTRRATLGAARAERLTSDLSGTGVMEVEQGCYEDDEPSSDAIGRSLSFRSGAGVFRYSDGAPSVPGGLDRAFAVAKAFADEAEPQAR